MDEAFVREVRLLDPEGDERRTGHPWDLPVIESLAMVELFSADGFYLLDEPEAALSIQNCLTCLRRVHGLVVAGSQFVIAVAAAALFAPGVSIAANRHARLAGQLVNHFLTDIQRHDVTGLRKFPS